MDFRAAIVAEARTWLGTPWHHAARVKGAGVDCGQFLIAAYTGAGLVPGFETGPYSIDHMMHSGEELFLGFVEAHLDRTDTPLPGDVAVWRYGRCFSHGAIVLDWPLIIHAHRPDRAVVLGDATKGALAREHRPEGGSQPREVRIYTIANRIGATP
jgi:cell wall-associated NlpC family hydrolase